MVPGVLAILGGVGLFLIGMAIMTDGLKNIAGGFLRKVLSKSTLSPTKGAVTGTVTTALVQSSSATTVMAVGFVSAGLLTFPQALGVIFGANIGTTITGWLVALFGFKLSLGQIVLPMVFIGALMRLFGGRRLKAWGFAIAGFAMVFIGISELQEGMSIFKSDITPESFPPNTWFGRFLLVLIGIAITIVTQSSSAGVATAITAVHVGNISLAQAAAMVIGMDVGTTVTAAMAIIGGSTDARRTGVAHVIYNLMTGVAAFLFLPLYIYGWEQLAPKAAVSNAEIALVMFHTTFNVLGVIAVIPLTYQFAAFIKWLIPDRGNDLVNRLDKSILNDPRIALINVQATLAAIVYRLFPIAEQLLSRKTKAAEVLDELELIDKSINSTRKYMQLIDVRELNEPTQKMGLASLHILDHLSRLVDRCQKQSMLEIAFKIEAIDTLRTDLAKQLHVDSLEPDHFDSIEEKLSEIWAQVNEEAERYRPKVMEQTVSGQLSIAEALERLDAFRWFRRVCHHVWRIVYHLNSENENELPKEIEPETDV